MKKITHFAFLAAMALALPWAAQAQHAGTSAGAPAAAPAPRSGVSHVSTGTMSARAHHAAPTAPVIVRGTGTAHRSGGTNSGSSSGSTGTTSSGSNTSVAVFNPDTGTTTFQDFTGQVPGLGFDFAHLAAINGNLAEKALIDPATQAEIALAERLNRGRVGGSAFFLSDFGGGAPVYEAPEAQPQAAPQIIIVQQPAAATASAPVAAATAPAAPQVEEEPVAVKSATEASDFLFVLKSGVMVAAVAFTRQGDQLVYVTKEGNRRTMSVSTIDSEATTQVNAARGVPLKLSI